MFVHSKAIKTFLKRCHLIALDELKNRFNVRVGRTRFHYNSYSFPLLIVAMDHPKILGSFESGSYQIAINKELMYFADDKLLREILTHELAHYFTFLEFGNDVFPHGKEFQSICHRYGLDANEAKATINIHEKRKQLTKDLAIFDKVQKLFSLASSSNSYEAEAAILKANELLIKYNIAHLHDQDLGMDEEFYIDRIFFAAKRNAKLLAIGDIVSTFFVKTVSSYTKEGVWLEVTGSLANVKFAQYVADFLNIELESMWLTQKKEHGLKGLREKNSFFAGVASGYTKKSLLIRKNIPSAKDLIPLEQKLSKAVHEFYRGLSNSSVGRSLDKNSHELGQKAGKEMNIRRGIQSNTSPKLLN